AGRGDRVACAIMLVRGEDNPVPFARANRRAFGAGLGAACAGLLAASVVAAGAAEEEAARSWRIDTEHLFGFVIGTDVGAVGDRELEAEVTGGLRQQTRSYAALRP